MPIAALTSKERFDRLIHEAMGEELAGMYASLDEPEHHLVHDMHFHQMVAAASGNKILTALMNMVATIQDQVRKKKG